jgi:hypothetical protein
VTFDCTSNPAIVDKARHKFLPKCIGSEEKMKVIFNSCGRKTKKKKNTHVKGRRKLSSTSDVCRKKMMIAVLTIT